MKIMRWVVVCLVLLFVCPGALHAEDEPGKKICLNVAKATRKVMQARMNGVSRGEFMKSISKEEDPIMKYFSEAMMDSIYDFVLIESDKTGEEATFALELMHYMTCMEIMSK